MSTTSALAPERESVEPPLDPALLHPRGRRSLGLVWRAHTVSAFGDEVTLVALPLATYARTGSALAVGVVAAMEAATTMIFGLWAGALGDRLRRRRTLVATDIGRALVLLLLAAMAVSGTAPLGALVAAAALLGVLRVLHDASAGAVLPLVVDDSDLLWANGRMHASSMTATAVGPALAGALIRVGGAASAFVADALTFLVSGRLVRRVPGLDRSDAPSDPLTARSLWADIREGLRAVWADQVVMKATVVVAAANVVTIAMEAQFIPFAREELGMGGLGVGAYVALAGSAAVVTSLLVGRSERVRGDAMLAGVGLLTPAVLLAGLMPSHLTVAIAFVVAGAGNGLFINHYYCLRQKRFPAELQGRVTMVTRMILMSMLPVAYLAGGQFAMATSPAMLFTALGIYGLAITFWAWFTGLGRLRVD